MTRQRMTRTFSILVVACLLGSGCIEQETDQTIYLEVDGSVTWQVVRHDVRSTSAESEELAHEEEEWLQRARRGDDPASRALAELAPMAWSSTLVRARRPFAVRAEATFAAPDLLVDAVLARLGVIAEVSLHEEHGVSTLMVHVDPSATEPDAIDDDAEIVDLIADLERIRLVAATGRFVAGRGFAIEDGGRVAWIRAPDSLTTTDDGSYVYELAWSGGEVSH